MGLIQIFLGGSTMDYAQSFIFRSRPGEMLLNNRDCQTTRGTEKFLEKSIQDLMRCGLVKSKRGACGGYTLACSPEQISFYDVTQRLRAHRSQAYQPQRRTPMKHSWYLFVLLLLSPVALTGCEVIGDIFKAGVWVGVLLVMLVIGIIVWLVTRSKA